MKTPNTFTTARIRNDFLDFFRGKGHTIVPSASLIPGNDPTLLFTNSGMVQFKDVFLGAEKRSYVRVADVQRCLRAGGKHNDLDSVGYTARHHTFFEMLGNWSFGDYFKEEAIAWAWQLLTEVWGLPAERLLVTVYHTDDDAYEIWRHSIGLSPDRIIRIGDNKGAPYASDNFWQMADTGPCGPCSEIFYDHGPAIPGGPPGSADEDGDRFIEIWNLVFMQFDRQPNGEMTPLPAPCVDTGMGLERLAAVLQHVHSNYEIDLFQALIRSAAELTNTRDLHDNSLKVIADHIRAAAFLIVDGVHPSNEGRGYVLRRITRRALRQGWKLGVEAPFFFKLVAPLTQLMGEAYPELVKAQSDVEHILLAEEEQFAKTLDAGMRIFDDIATGISGKTIPGEDVFRLYDTYGFPADLTADIARERGMAVDMVGFETSMEQQRSRAREGKNKFSGVATLPAELVARLDPPVFLGYDSLQTEALKVVAILKEGNSVPLIEQGDDAVIFLDRTPFYAESGGQVGDTGQLFNASDTVFDVSDTKKYAETFHGHVGHLSKGKVAVGDVLSGTVDCERRNATVLNHSATHLLHAALREVLGGHVQQRGSLVAPDRLRFDFSHTRAMRREELVEVENRVNLQIRRNHPIDIQHMSMQEALDFGALALFGEKYGERVRVLKMGDYSTELCGGTHARRTGDIGLFKIVSEGGVAAGVRRIEAVTGEGALALVAQEEQRLHDIAVLLNSSPHDLVERLQSQIEHNRVLERELSRFKAKAASATTANLAASVVKLGDVNVLATRLEGLDAKALREVIDRLKQQLENTVIVLAGVKEDGAVALVAGVNGPIIGKVKAGELLAFVASQIGGKGGGRSDLAQGGGKDGPALASALQSVVDWVEQRV